MSRVVSLNARKNRDALATADIEVVLVHIEHPDTPTPIRLSSDNAVRLSVEPLTYGTVSTFASVGGTLSPFYFVGMRAVLPDDEDGVAATVTLGLDVLETDIVDLLTSTTKKASCRIAVVMASTPNLVERETTGLLMESASGDWGQVQIKFTMQNLYDEPYPAIRFSKQRFPGLFK